MEMIKIYLNKPNKKNLHDLRVECRRRLSQLRKEGIIDLGLKAILKNSSKLRDTDVLLKICKDKDIREYLKKRRKKLKKRFIEFLKNVKCEQKEFKKEIIDCKSLLNETYLDKSDKELHQIRVKIKKCRYAYNLEELKPIQEYLGKAHDFYVCEKICKKFNKKCKKVTKKKLKYIKKAEKVKNKLKITLLESKNLQ